MLNLCGRGWFKDMNLDLVIGNIIIYLMVGEPFLLNLRAFNRDLSWISGCGSLQKARMVFIGKLSLGSMAFILEDSWLLGFLGMPHGAL